MVEMDAGADRKGFQTKLDNRGDDIHFFITDPESILSEDWRICPAKQIVSRFMSMGYLHAKKRTTNSNCPDTGFGSSLKKNPHTKPLYNEAQVHSQNHFAAACNPEDHARIRSP